jgi:LmbE family N-acetylglucosaminyl deacetylase
MSVGAEVRQSDVVLVVAHPDDEIFVSGTLCLLAEKGLSITLVCVTDGEGGGRDLVHPRSGASLASVRRRELSLSGSVLGVREVFFLSYPDVGESADPKAEPWAEKDLVTSLDVIFRESKPELILTHGPKGGYGHPAHTAVHNCVMKAAENSSFSGAIFSFCGMVERSPLSYWFDDPSDVLIDASEFLSRRAASLSYHQSQLGYFLQPYFPQSLRDFRSTFLSYALFFTAFGRKRIPIGTATRFFKRYPTEGLVLQKPACDFRSTCFLERFSDDRRIKIIRQSSAAPTTRKSVAVRALKQA